MLKRVLYAGGLCLCLIATAMGCSSSRPIRLEPQSVPNYEGMDLTPAGSLRENSILGVQEVDLAEYTLSIRGQVERPLTLSYEEVLQHTLYEKVVRLYCVEGWDALILWEGVLIRDLLEAAKPQPSAVTVIFHATDGYTTSLPLETIVRRDMLLAHKANGEVLPARLGFPFIVVAEAKLGYKWARWVTAIELSDDADFRGYWEQRGYDNDAEVMGF